MGTRYSYDIENLRMCAVVFTAEMTLLIASPLSLFVTGMHLLFRLGGLLSITFVRNAPSERWQIHYYLLSTLPLWLPVLGLYVYQEDISYRSFVCFAAAQSSGRLLDVYFAALPRTNSLKLNTDEEWRTVHSWDIFQCVAHLFILSDVRYGVILPNEEQSLSQRLRRFVRGLFGMLCAGLIPAVVLGGLLPLCPLSWQQSPILLFYLFLLNFPAVMHSLDPMYALYSTFGSVKFESVMDGTPFLTCTSLGDFWRRWNVPIQRNFHSYVYRPCRSHLKMSPTLALMVTFFASAFYHMVGIFLMGAPIRMVIAVGFFFIGESVGIVLERMLLPSFLRVVGPSRQYMWIWGYNALILPLFVLPWIL